MNDFLIQNSFRSQWRWNLGFVYIASNDFLIQFLQFSTLVKKRVFEQTPNKILLFCLTFGASSSFSFWPKPAGRPASFFPVFCTPQSFPNVFTEASWPAMDSKLRSLLMRCQSRACPFTWITWIQRSPCTTLKDFVIAVMLGEEWLARVICCNLPACYFTRVPNLMCTR